MYDFIESWSRLGGGKIYVVLFYYRIGTLFKRISGICKGFKFIYDYKKKFIEISLEVLLIVKVIIFK